MTEIGVTPMREMARCLTEIGAGRVRKYHRRLLTGAESPAAAAQKGGSRMSEPVMFISHFRIKEGMLGAVKDLQAIVTPQLDADKPRTLAFLAYLNEGATELAFVHLFADADSMDAHFEGAQERAQAAYELLEPQGWDIYGSPSSQAWENLRKAATSAGVALNVQPIFMAGFLRVAAP